jgi:oxygen-independent coproporphyrinogen-3 oxidase
VASLYLHIPFCEHKCIYCDFYSIESIDPMESFVRALKNEILLHDSYAAKESFETIFFGGGTPSLLSPAVLGEILNLLSKTFTITPNAEITMEANPGTVEQKKLGDFRAAGVNRISFGVQSFHDDELRFLTRIHSADEAESAIRSARACGFGNVSLDLIFALPGQTMEKWMSNLERAARLDLEHLSAYSLIVEQNTPLSRMVRSKQVSQLPLETEADMYQATMAFLHAKGYEHYEISNYGKPGYFSRHNMNYWNHSNYLGFGPSAHSYWTGKRWWNISNVQNYCDMISAGRLPRAGEEQLELAQLFDERIMLGLRSDGIDLERLRREFGGEVLAPYRETIDLLIGEQLATATEASLRLTDKGYLLCDEITQRFLATPSAA